MVTVEPYAVGQRSRRRVARAYGGSKLGNRQSVVGRRPIWYLRESFLYGRTFLGDADLNAQGLDWFETVANARVENHILFPLDKPEGMQAVDLLAFDRGLEREVEVDERLRGG